MEAPARPPVRPVAPAAPPSGTLVEVPAVRRPAGALSASAPAVSAAAAGGGCLVPECEAPVLAKQLCETHYRIMRRTLAAGGSFEPTTQRPARLRTAERNCAEPGCTEAHYAKGLCRRHYMTARSRIRAAGKHGMPADAVQPSVVFERSEPAEEEAPESQPFAVHGNGGRDAALAVPLFADDTLAGEAPKEALPTAEMVARVVAQFRGGLDRVAEVLGRNRRTLMDLLLRLDLMSYVNRVRDQERQRIKTAPLNERLDDLLFREKLLEDLDCLKEVDRRTEFEVKMRCAELAKSSETIEEVLQQLASQLELDDAGLKRLNWRYDLRRHLRGLKLKPANPALRTRA